MARSRTSRRPKRIGVSSVALLLFCLGGGSAACNVVLGIEAAETVESLGGGGGVAAACVKDPECDDGNPCTTDRCASGSCVATPNNRYVPEQTDGDCRAIRCVDGALVEEQDDGDLPFDDSDCTNDVCNNGIGTNPSIAAGTSCATNGGTKCNGSGVCVECISNADCNGSDTCGGDGMPGFCGCMPSMTCTMEGVTCGLRPDDGCGNVLDCNDNMQNGDETDVDCGGPTVGLGGTCDTRCQTGKSCDGNIDCVSGVCSNNICT
jgi:hypothetical protein